MANKTIKIWNFASGRLSFFLIWGGTCSLHMPALRPAAHDGPMCNPREGTSVVLSMIWYEQLQSAHIIVHHCNSTQCCSSETILLSFPFLQTNNTPHKWPNETGVGRRRSSRTATI